MVDQLAVGSPEWWLNRLYKKLLDRRDAIATLESYYDGDHPMAFATEQFRSAFHGLFRHLSDNWCGLVVDAVEERLNVQGFRITDKIDLQDPPPPPDLLNPVGSADRDAWLIWQRNNMDAGSQMAHNAAFTTGLANALVWADADGKAVITPEHPSQTIVEKVPGSPRRRAAALKTWRDDWTGFIMATVYLPEGLFKFMSEKPVKTGGGTTRIKWVQRLVKDESWPLENPLAVVPMVPLHNKERLLDDCDSEIRTVIPIQNAVNKLVADMLVASEFQAFRQRWATGLEVPVNPDTNQPIEPFKSAVDRLWVSEDSDTTFGEFAQADLRIFVAAIEMFVQHIATQSRTPPHYFYLSGQFPSGEAIKSAETGLVAKSRRRMTHFSESWEEVMRLAFAVEDDPRKDAVLSETLWADPESRSEGEHTDALTKLSTIGVPNEALWEKWGFSPQEIARFRQMREAEKALAPPPPPVVLSVMPGAPIPNGQPDQPAPAPIGG